MGRKPDETTEQWSARASAQYRAAWEAFGVVWRRVAGTGPGAREDIRCWTRGTTAPWTPLTMLTTSAVRRRSLSTMSIGPCSAPARRDADKAGGRELQTSTIGRSPHHAGAGKTEPNVKSLVRPRAGLSGLGLAPGAPSQSEPFLLKCAGLSGIIRPLSRL